MQRTSMLLFDPYIYNLRVLITEYIHTTNPEKLTKIETLMKEKNFPHQSSFLLHSLSNLNYDIFCRPFEPKYKHAPHKAIKMAVTLLETISRNLKEQSRADLLLLPIFHLNKPPYNMATIFCITHLQSAPLFNAYCEQLEKLIETAFLPSHYRDKLFCGRDKQGHSALFYALKSNDIEFLNAFFSYIYNIKKEPLDRQNFIRDMLVGLIDTKLIETLIFFCEDNHFQFNQKINFLEHSSTIAELTRILDLINGERNLSVDVDAACEEAAEKKEEQENPEKPPTLILQNLGSKKIQTLSSAPTILDEHDKKIEPSAVRTQPQERKHPDKLVWQQLSELNFQGLLFAGSPAGPAHTAPAATIAPKPPTPRPGNPARED